MIKMIVSKYQAVFVFTAMIIVMGLTSYNSLPRENFPEIKRPKIFVTTVYPGVSAADIESLVTKEIEREIDGIEGLDDLSSTSSQGVSNVTVEFTSDTEVEIALRRVKERVDLAKTKLPAEAEEPIVKELSFSEIPIMITALTHPNGIRNLERVTDDLEDEILKVDGILSISISGKPTKEVAIDIYPEKLRQYRFSLDDVASAVASENVAIPGGTLKSRQQDYSLSVSGEIKDPTLFGEIVVQKDDRRAKIKDLGTVRYEYADPDSVAKVNGMPAISLAIKKRGGENLLRIVDEVKEIVGAYQSKLPSGTRVAYTMDASRQVLDMVYDLENNIFTGLILVILTTLFFLGPLNATFVSLGIPFSMLISFVILQIMGITLNMVVLFSLILALGMLVDNGIVIVENIYRHRSLGKSRVDAAVKGCAEVAIPIGTSTLTTVLAFFPIVYMPGIMGEFMAYLPKTVIIVLVSSFLVAITITTVFCARFLRYNKASAQAIESGSGVFNRLLVLYEKVLNWSLNRPVVVMVIAILMVLTGIFMQSNYGNDAVFFPKTDPAAATVSIKLPAGTPLAETQNFTSPIEQKIASIDASVESIQTTVGASANAGGGEGGPGATEARRADIRVGFLPFVERTSSTRQSVYDYMSAVERIPGADIKVKAAEDGPPSGHDLDFEITGVDYEIIGKLANQVYQAIAVHAGSYDRMENEYEAIKPEVKINIDREKAASYGLNTRLIASTVRNIFSGKVVSKYRQGKEEDDVVVRYDRASRTRLSSLSEVEIVQKESRILLSSVANIENISTVPTINRHSRKRAVAVYADFREEAPDKDKIKSLVQQEISRIEVPIGYQITAGKGQDVRDESTQFLMQAFLSALMLIFMVLVVQFDSVTQPLIILVSVFLSLGGVLWGLFLFDQKFVIIMSGIGIISLAGVVVNNAIVLIDFINQQLRSGAELKDALIISGKARLRPVLLTALTTVIGLLPMGFGVSLDFHNLTIQFGSESAQFWAPMAWTVIFGLSFATVLTLIVVPTLVYIDKVLARKVSAFWRREIPSS